MTTAKTIHGKEESLVDWLNNHPSQHTQEGLVASRLEISAEVLAAHHMNHRRRASCASEAALSRLRWSLLVPAAQTSCLSSLPLPAWPSSRCTYWHSSIFSPFGDLTGCSSSLPTIIVGRPANAQCPCMSAAFSREQMFTISWGASPVLAFDAPRGRVFCAGDSEENASVETEVREEMRHEKCGMSSVHGGEARREKTDVCENEDEFVERVTQVKAEKEQVKRVRFRVEEETEETRAQIAISGRGRTSTIQGADQRKKLDFISVEICSEGKKKETEEKVHLEEKEESEAKNYCSA